MDEFHLRSEAEYTDALERFPYPLEIVHGRDALAAYERLKARDGHTPVVIGGPSELAMVFEGYEIGLEQEPSAALILERAGELRFPADLRAQKDREFAAFRKTYPDIVFEDDDEADANDGDWPVDVEYGGAGLTVAEDVLSDEPWPRVHIALLPTRDPTEAPAYLRAGGWNDCPEAVHQVAALRAWRDRYGAELIGCSHDTMNIRVQRQPSSRDEALALAREQHLFCSDMLNEMTLAELGAYLLENDWWFFWWD